MHLLVTRPRAEAERTAELLRARGHAALVAPLLEIDPVTDVRFEGGPWDAILMTSGNAARAVAPVAAMLRSLAVIAVGERTAQAARHAGFTSVFDAGGDGEDLARLLEARMRSRARLLYLAGSDRARDFAALLAPKGISVDIVVVYRARASETLPEQARAALEGGELDAALHYSRRTAAILVTSAARAGLAREVSRLSHYCLSERVAGPLRESGARSIAVAPRPEEESLVDLLD